jgi:acetyl esterase/lipase
MTLNLGKIMKLRLQYLLSIVLVVVSNITCAEYDIKTDVIYGHKDGTALVYHVVVPENANGAAVVEIVSSGWRSRWATPESRTEYFAFLLDAGYTMFHIFHRSAPRYLVPENYADVSLAIRHINLHAEIYGVDAEKIGVFGRSAGGHLSMMIGLDSDPGDPVAEDDILRHNNRVSAVVSYNAAVDLTEVAAYVDRYPALGFPTEQAPSVSPIYHVDSEDPPILLVHGDRDREVPISQSEIMLAALQENSVDSELLTLPGAPHTPYRGEYLVQASNATLNWFNTHLLGM